MSVQMTGFNDYDLERRRPDYHIVLTGDRFEQMIRFLESSKILVFDTETSGLEWFRESRICGVALAGTVDGQTHHFYTPFRHCTGEAQLDIERVSPDIRKLLAGPQLKIGHHLKFDKHMANREGWVVAAPWYDTMIAAKLYDENRYVALKTRAVEDLGESQAKVGEGRVDEMVHRLAKQQRMGVEAYRAQYGYSQVPIWLLGEYACGDTEFTNRLHIFYEQTHRSISQRYARIWKTEMDLLDVICDMEEQGIAIDVEYLSKLRLRLQLELQRVEAEITVLLGGRKLELGSDVVIRKLLLEDLGCRLHKMTRGGAKGTAKQFAVDKEVLADFSHVHPAIERILAWREAEKLANTYTLSILDRLDSRNYLHPDFQQMGTTSGRLCVAGDTILDTSIGSLCISDLDLHNNQNVLIMTHRGRLRPILAKYYKGREQMYRVILDDGSTITCTAGHRFLTPDGWRSLREVAYGGEVCGAGGDFGLGQGSQLRAEKSAVRGFVCTDSFERAVDPGRSAGEIWDRWACLFNFFGSVPIKIFRRVVGGSKVEIRKVEDRKQKRRAPTSNQDFPPLFGEAFAQGLSGGGDSREAQDDSLVCSAQHGNAGVGFGAAVAIAATGDRYGFPGPVRAGFPGDHEVGRAGIFLRASARVFFGIASRLLLAGRSAFFRQRAREGAQLLCGAEAGSSGSYLLVPQCRRDSVISGAARFRRTAYSRVHVPQKLPCRFLDYRNLFAGGGGWGVPYQGSQDQKERCGSGEGVRGVGVSGDSIPAGRGLTRSVDGGESRPVRKIVGVEPVGIQDVWDIEVGEDHSYLAAGFINHNSCKSPNFQNQPVDDDDRAKKHSGKSLEEGGTDPWSIRRSYVVGRPGWVRLFFDYSQIELRVLAYYTKDPILVAAYMNGEDIHTRTSIEVFGTAEKAMRRLAKVINFGLCISEGQRVLTQQDGLVPIERVQDHHLLWDGVEWVKHDGLVCRGVEEVLTYDGITATPDHVVYLRDGGAATLRDAASAIYSRRLAVGAIGETPVRFVSVDRAGGKDSSGRWEAASGGGVAVRELRGDQMVFGRQCSRWSFFLRLSEGEIPRQARRYFGWALRCYGAALRAGYARFLEELQGAGDQGSVQVTGAFCPVGFEEVSRIGFPGIGLRSHRQRWGLLSRKSATGDSFGEFAQSQQAKVYDLINAGPRHRFTVEGRVVSNSYGLSPVGFARQVHVSREEAESYFNKFFERYHGIVDFRDTFWAQVRRQKGYFQNLFGRPRRVQGMNISDNFERGKAEREAIASLIQGTAAELTKESLVRIAHYLKDRALPAKLISTVHDEIQLDCAAEVLPEVAIAVKRLMEDYSEFSPIPIRVDGDYTVRSWSDKTKLPKA